VTYTEFHGNRCRSVGSVTCKQAEFKKLVDASSPHSLYALNCVCQSAVVIATQLIRPELRDSLPNSVHVIKSSATCKKHVKACSNVQLVSDLCVWRMSYLPSARINVLVQW
jgi:hypothetical protein